MGGVSVQPEQNKIREESEALIRLGMLLRQRRNATAQDSVQKVLQSRVSSADKVRRIEEIDRRIDDRNQPDNGQEHATAEVVSNSRRYISVDPSPPPVERLKARRPPRVKAPLSRNGYFAFFFRHRLRIREFGQATATIAPGGFPPGVKVTESVPAFFAGFLRPAARDIPHLLLQLMGNAWMHLTKKEYNLLVLLLDLCERIDRVSAGGAQFSNGSALSKLMLVEDRLLSIRYNDDSVPRIHEAILTLMARNRREIENLDALPLLVTRMISRTEGEISLIDAMLALNMVYYRRYVTEEDLVLSGLGALVETRTFDCSDGTMERIEESVARLEAQLETLDQEYRSVLKVRALVKKDEKGDILLEPLKKLVSAGSGYSWETVAANPPHLAEILFDTFRAQVWELAAGPLKMEAVGTTRLFTGAPFDADMERLALAVGNIRDQLTELQMLSRERLSALRDKRERATRYESEFLMQLQLGLDIVTATRDRLATFLQNEVPPTRGFEPVDVGAAGDAGRGLPLSAQIVGASRFEGMSLRSAIETVVTEAHLICFVFGDKEIRRLLSREQHIQRDMEHILQTVERIAPAERATEIVKLYGSAPVP